jgi:hypothetical protein
MIRRPRENGPSGGLNVTPPGDTRTMERQLVLIEVEEEWRLDEPTREIGRSGVEQARAALSEARRLAHSEQPSAA